MPHLAEDNLCAQSYTTVKQNQRLLQRNWVVSEMVKRWEMLEFHHPPGLESQGRREWVCSYLFVLFFLPNSLLEVCRWHQHLQMFQNAGSKLVQNETAQQHAQKWHLLGQTANWRTEVEIWVCSEQTLPLSQCCCPKKWAGLGKLPAAEKAGKNEPGFQKAEHCVLPMTHLTLHPSCRQTDIPTVTNIITS